METRNCYHCGLGVIEKDALFFENQVFCCTGCKTVYEIFSHNGLTDYYSYEKAPGSTPKNTAGKYDFLDNQDIAERLMEFKEQQTHIVSLYIPVIHCSSCIWILENLSRLNTGITNSQVNFHEKKVRIIFNPDLVSLKEVVLLLCAIAYEPYISLENYDKPEKQANRELVYKLGVAFFCFGNVMLLSFLNILR